MKGHNDHDIINLNFQLQRNTQVAEQLIIVKLLYYISNYINWNLHLFLHLTWRNINLFIGNVTVILINAAPHPQINSLPSSTTGPVNATDVVVVAISSDDAGRPNALTGSLTLLQDFSPVLGSTAPREGGRLLWSCPTTLIPQKKKILSPLVTKKKKDIKDDGYGR